MIQLDRPGILYMHCQIDEGYRDDFVEAMAAIRREIQSDHGSHADLWRVWHH